MAEKDHPKYYRGFDDGERVDERAAEFSDDPSDDDLGDAIHELIEVVQEELSPALRQLGIYAILAGTKIVELGQEWNHGRK